MSSEEIKILKTCRTLHFVLKFPKQQYDIMNCSYVWISSQTKEKNNYKEVITTSKEAKLKFKKLLMKLQWNWVKLQFKLKFWKQATHWWFTSHFLLLVSSVFMNIRAQAIIFQCLPGPQFRCNQLHKTFTHTVFN